MLEWHTSRHPSGQAGFGCGFRDLDLLRTHGFDDRAIHHAVQVIGFFNYISRIADALGVEPEAFMEGM